MKEIWKDVIGYEGLYQISSLGRLKSNRYGRMIKGNINSYGYLRTILSDRNGNIKRVLIHRLVAEAFIPNTDNKPQVNHRDENKLNNAVDNLEWVTCKENINWGTSLQKRAKTQRLSQSNKKTVLQYDKNGVFINKYISIRDAARVLGIDRTGIQHCCNKRKGFDTYKGSIWRYEEKT